MRIRTWFYFCLLVVLSVTAYSGAQDTNFATGPQYLLTGSTLLAHSLTTPSLSLDAPLPPIQSSSISTPDSATGVPFTTNPLLEHQADLIPVYYGTPSYYVPTKVSVIEISYSEGAAEPAAALPASIVESGVTQFVDPQLLRVRGYGVPLGDVAAYWKTHKLPAQRTYTSVTIKHLHPAS